MNAASDQFFSWLNARFTELYLVIVQYFQDYFSHPVRVSNGKWLSGLYNNSFGFAGTLTYILLYVTLFLSFFRWNYIARFGQLLVVAIFLSVIAPFFFLFCDWLLDVRDAAAKLAMFDIQSPNPDQLIGEFQALVSILANIVATLTTAFFGAVLMVVFMLFEVVAVGVKILFLPTVAAWPVFDKAKDLLETLMSAGLVTMLTGTPTAVLLIQIGKAIAPSVTGSQNSIVTPVVTTASVIAALFVVLRMFKATQRVVSRGMSNVRGKTGVNGKVDIGSMPAADPKAIAAQQTAGMPIAPTVSMSGSTSVANLPSKQETLKRLADRGQAIEMLKSSTKKVAMKGIVAGATAIPGVNAAVAGGKAVAAGTKTAVKVGREAADVVRDVRQQRAQSGRHDDPSSPYYSGNDREV